MREMSSLRETGSLREFSSLREIVNLIGNSNFGEFSSLKKNWYFDAGGDEKLQRV